MRNPRNSAKQLDKIFKPRNLALIGASNRTDSIGYAVMQNLIKSGFEGNIYPINLKYSEIQGFPSFRSIGKVPVKVDLAIITTPARTVPGIVEECGKAGVGGLVIISAGFKEVGGEGLQMYEQIREIAQQYHMRLIGPNCVGITNPHLKLNASFTTHMAQKGNIAFISQSGALCAAILDWSLSQNVGFSHFVSLGSMIDVGYADLIDYFGTDSNTASILIYMETLKGARKFMSAARAFSRNKPIIILKSGKSQEGSQAAMSHTGSLAGNDAVYDAAFRRAGIIRVETIAQLFNCAQALAMQPRPRDKRLTIITNAGGPAVLATDHLIANGGAIATLSEETKTALNAILPPHWSRNNPVDVLGDASAAVFRKAAEICLQDEATDALLVIFTPQTVTDPTEAAEQLVLASKQAKKPIFAVWMGENDVANGRDVLEFGKIPNYRYPESAVDVFLKMYQYSRNLALLNETPTAIPVECEPDTEAALHLIQTFVQTGKAQLNELEAKQLLRYYQIPTTQGQLAKTSAEAIAIANEMGYPVVLKIVCSSISHKTDAGGIRLQLEDAEAVAIAFQEVLKAGKMYAPAANIEGVLVEPMIEKAKMELLIGAKKDPVFGPVIAFGSGGVAVEIFKDIQLGLPPLNMALAKQIVENTKIYPLLKGYRGTQGVNLQELLLTLRKLSYLVMDFPEVKEVDINPYLADETGGIVVDARILLDTTVNRKKGLPYEHMVISPYPTKYFKKVKTKEALDVLLRPIQPEDEPLVEKMFGYISKESLYFRFFGYVPHVTHDFLTRFTNIDYDREIAIIAEVEENEARKMIGVVRIITDGWGESAEYAILIADPWQKHGLGSIMTDFILEVAKDKGISKIYASVLATNKGMLRLFEKKGFRIKREGFDSYYAEIDL